MSRLILGLNTDHGDSSAALVGDNGIIAAIAEERINRKKHCADFPALAIKEVLRIAGADIGDVTDIAMARNPKANLPQKLAFVAKTPKRGLSMARRRLAVHRKVASIEQTIADELGVDSNVIKAETHAVEHHLAHVASAFYWSPFERACAFTVDGAGDFATAMWAECEGNNIDIIHRALWPHSLGVFYSGVCQFIGFNRYGEEYKVMGLSAYGRNRYSNLMRRLVSYNPHDGLRLNLDFFSHHKMDGSFEAIQEGVVTVPRLWSSKFEEELGPARQRDEPIGQRERDMAASMQIRYEEVFLDMVTELVRRTGIRDIVMAGGCARCNRRGRDRQLRRACELLQLREMRESLRPRHGHPRH